ncbi:MAG: PIN domain-containing protein [Candidatus Bathyarchaeia archaeon]
MRSVRSGLEAVVDVGIIVIAHFRNPARKYAAQLLLEAIAMKRPLLIPVSAYLGAYVIMTRYLGLRCDRVARALLETLSLESPAFYESIPKTLAEKAIASASELNISSWDGYLIELAKDLRIAKIYTVDEELARKVKDIEVVNPIPENVMEEYHKFLEERLFEESGL